MTNTLVDEVLNLPAAERLELMDRIWASLAQNPQLIPMSDEHRTIVEARLAAHREHPERAIS
jgi:putative addiction module component (TIGR02574 family)